MLLWRLCVVCGWNKAHVSFMSLSNCNVGLFWDKLTFLIQLWAKMARAFNNHLIGDIKKDFKFVIFWVGQLVHYLHTFLQNIEMFFLIKITILKVILSHLMIPLAQHNNNYA